MGMIGFEDGKLITCSGGVRSVISLNCAAH